MYIQMFIYLYFLLYIKSVEVGVLCRILYCLSFYHHKLTHISHVSFLWDIGKQNSPRCDAAKRGVPSGTILFAYKNFIDAFNDKDTKVLSSRVG